MSQNEIIEFIQFGYVLNIIAFVLVILSVIVDLFRNFIFTVKVSEEIQVISKEFRELSIKHNRVKYLFSKFALFIPFVFAYDFFSLYSNYAKRANWNVLLMAYISMSDRILKMKEQK